MKQLSFAFLLLSSSILFSQNELSPDELIRRKIENQKHQGLSAGNEIILCNLTLTKVYENRVFDLAWENKNDLKELINSLEESKYEGLNPHDYHITEIKSLYIQFDKLTNDQKVQLDLLATDAFLLYTSHLLSGKVNPKSIDSEWHVARREGDPVQVLNSALENHQIKNEINNVKPRHEVYQSLKAALIKYDSIKANGGWKQIPEGQVLKIGMIDERVPLICNRLYISGDYIITIDEKNLVYNEELINAVKHFQKRHGLESDGNIDKETIAALNVPIDDRIDQIIVNMERWRWLPQEYSDYYVKVNIANFLVDVVKNGRLIKQHKAIVGKNYRRTPVFSSKISYLVLNPTWTVPPGIIKGDVIPGVKKDINYLKNKNLTVYDHSGNILDPNLIDWNNPSSRSYIYRQPAGPANALGAVKFMFPNEFSVYLHDTPGRELFDKTERSFSSGCIRVQNPLELAEYLINDSVNWNLKKIKKQVDSQVTITVPLSHKPDIYLLYWTAWTDDKAVVQFRKDIYSRDEKLKIALAEKPKD